MPFLFIGCFKARSPAILKVYLIVSDSSFRHAIHMADSLWDAEEAMGTRLCLLPLIPPKILEFGFSCRARRYNASPSPASMPHRMISVALPVFTPLSLYHALKIIARPFILAEYFEEYQTYDASLLIYKSFHAWFYIDWVVFSVEDRALVLVYIWRMTCGILFVFDEIHYFIFTAAFGRLHDCLLFFTPKLRVVYIISSSDFTPFQRRLRTRAASAAKMSFLVASDIACFMEELRKSPVPQDISAWLWLFRSKHCRLVVYKAWRVIKLDAFSSLVEVIPSGSLACRYFLLDER